MRLTVHTDYALRMLMVLARHQETLITAREVSEIYDISAQHLSKVAQTLADLGIIDTVRGRGGGLRLAKVPTDIRLGSIIRTLEQGSALVECFPGGRNTCCISPACRLSGILAEAQQAFYGVLNNYTLADLTDENPALHGLLAGHST